jgi:MerR family transcriptional regulator, light-induced transcriptional regulator
VDLRTAADRLGVHYQTAYRWVREGSLPAVKRGAAYDVDERALLQFQAARAEPSPPPARAHVRSWDHQVQRLYGLLAAGDELGCRAVVDRLREGGIEPVVLCDALLGPAMGLVGDAWATGQLSVAEEHRTAAICDRLLARLAVHPRGRPRGVAVTATPVGEEHGLPSTMAAVVLRADRWQVHHLGTQVPTPDLVDLVRTIGADLVVLSVVNSDAVDDGERTGEEVRRASAAEVVVGGPGSRLSDLVSLARGLRR